MKKFISMLLVIAMMLTVLAVGIATTSAAETATITIYGLDGSTEVKEFEVGDEFTVYTTLDVSASVDGGLVGSVQGYQTYSAGVLSLVDETAGEYGDIVDLETVFPIMGSATMANGAEAGAVYYNASKANGFKFDSSTSQLIVTTYKVIAAGSAEVKNYLENLAAADENMTKIVYNDKVQEGKSVSGIASFDVPLPDIDHAEVTIHALDGSTETETFQIGDTFTVYTMLDAAASAENGMISSVQGVQRYTTSVLELADELDADGMIAEPADVFPVTGASTLSNAGQKGQIKYAASTPSMTNAFAFVEDAQLLKTTYTVKANGYANITNSLIVLAAADEDATKIVFGGVTQPGKSFSIGSSFSAETPTTTKVTIIGPNGKAEVKEFNVGDTFTVYTMLDVTSAIANGMLSSIDGYQTFTTSKLELTDAVSGEYNEIVDKAAMFPVFGSDTNTIAGVKNGKISFNATKPQYNNGFVFNSATSKVIVTNYKVKAAGKATITTKFVTLVAADEDATRIVTKGADVKEYTMFESFTDGGETPTEKPTEAPTQKPTEPATQPPTEKPTQKPTNPTNQAVITIIGIDGKTEQKTFNVGDTFTVYTTLNVANATSNGKISSINAQQTFTTDILATTDTDYDDEGVYLDAAAAIMFPNLQNAMGRYTNGQIRYNATVPTGGMQFASDETLLMVSNYKVLKAGTGEVRNVINMLVDADYTALNRLVNKGVIKEGINLGSITTFAEPGKEPATEPATEKPTEPDGIRFMLGDVDGNEKVQIRDAGYIQRRAAEMDSDYDDVIEYRGDADLNGKITIMDCTYIQMYVAEMVTNYPIGEYFYYKG